jgi:hypothetical protein
MWGFLVLLVILIVCLVTGQSSEQLLNDYGAPTQTMKSAKQAKVAPAPLEPIIGKKAKSGNKVRFSNSRHERHYSKKDGHITCEQQAATFQPNTEPE